MTAPATLVLFDIDGTILLTAGAGRRALTEALGDLVEPNAAVGQVRFDGKTDPQIIRELLAAGGHPDADDPSLALSICERYVGILAAELRQPRSVTTVMPGVTALLDTLEAHPAVVLGLLTGNVAQGAALKLAAAGINVARFGVGAYGSDSHHRPDLPAIAARRALPFFGREPRGHEVVIIGDTPADVTCGREIGARAIGVATGAYSVAELRAAGAHAAFDTLAETALVLEAILATELELKAVVADPAALRARLREAGAVRQFRGFMRDRRFDRGGELDARDEVLRLRLWHPEGEGPHRAVVAFKGPTTVSPAGYKHRDELEYDAAPGAAVLATFQALGYVITHAIDRFVEVWRHEGTTVRLEWYPRMDVLAEIEGDPDGIEATIRSVGLERRACLPDALVSFTARYQQRTGRTACLAEAELEDQPPGWVTA